MKVVVVLALAVVAQAFRPAGSAALKGCATFGFDVAQGFSPAVLERPRVVAVASLTEPLPTSHERSAAAG